MNRVELIGLIFWILVSAGHPTNSLVALDQCPHIQTSNITALLVVSELPPPFCPAADVLDWNDVWEMVKQWKSVDHPPMREPMCLTFTLVKYYPWSPDQYMREMNECIDSYANGTGHICLKQASE